MAEPAQQTLPEHVTLPLLDLVVQQSLDQDYLTLAERRSREGASPESSRTAVVAALVVLCLFGALVATAAVQKTREAGVDATSRAALIDQITQRRKTLTTTQARIGRLRARTAGLEQEAQDNVASQKAAGQRVQRLLTRTGFGAVRGPGVTMILEDSPSGLPEEAVRDTDLAQLVNALWAIGAEAIAVNNERLTVFSSIRNVDLAIHVNGRPVSAPYVVDAIGDPRTMQADLADSPRGQAFLGLTEAVGLQLKISNEQELILPAAQLRPLRAVTSGQGVENGSVNLPKEVVP